MASQLIMEVKKFVTCEERQQLREAAIAATRGVRDRMRERDMSGRLPGDWELQTSNSFQRIGAHGDGDVLCAVTQRSDGHPDLLAAKGVLDYVVAAQPKVVLALLDHVDKIEQDVASLDKSRLESRPQTTDQRASFEEMLGLDSANYLRTGLSFREFMQLHSAEKLAAAWSLQSRAEQRRRLGAVVRLSAELARVRETENFATRLAELAIESVIEGDWKMVEEWAEHFSFADEHEEIRQRHVATFAVFRELLLQALRAGKETPA